MRTRRLLAIVALAVGLQSAGAPDGAAATRITALTSPGGISAWLVHEPSIPIITLDIAFRGGSALDPLGKEGVAYLVSGLLDEGAGDYDALAFQRRLEELAIGMGADSYKDSFRVRLKTLSRHRDEAFRLLGLALSPPRFDEDAVTRVRAQILNNLARRAEDPDAIAGRTWFSRAFPSHPYGRPGRGTSESMASLEADDLSRDVTQAEQRLAEEQTVVAAEREGIEQERTALQAQLATFDVERNKVAEQLPSQAMSLFKTLARGRNGVAVVEARQGRCTSCQVRLRPQLFNDVRSNSALIQCESCQRILYFAEHQAVAG